MAGSSWFARLDPPPDVFALVMATGIVSIAADDHGYRRIGTALGVLALVAFVLLGLGFLIRLATRPHRVIKLTRDPDVALRMFTFVAACAVLASRWSARTTAGWALGGLGLAGWLVLMPLAVIDVRSRPTEELRDHAHGAWLLPSVATSGLAITAAELALHVRASWLVWVAVLAWVLALLIYLVVGTLIVWRALAAPFTPDEVSPDSWILMGALAIATLAGADILLAVRGLGEPAGLVRSARAMTFGVWVAASLWIPPLLYAQMWYADRTVGALRYHGVWWSGVFPIGMYSAASSATAGELRMPALTTISLVFFWIACTIWLLVATGLGHSAVNRALARPARPGRPT